MRRILPLFLALFLAVPALALDFSGSNLPYSDVHPGSAEGVAIGLLTSKGIVGGYPDGTFGAAKTLNRAEFLKIILESSPAFSVSVNDAKSCFPDVHLEDWFSRYVCFAKEHGFIGGYPDGTFKPWSAVNYAEALKMTATVFGYETSPQEGDEWFDPYYRATTEKGIVLPQAIALNAYISRGQMARLAAAALSESQGTLETYRAAERGETISSESSSSSVSSIDSSSSSISSASSSVSSLSSLFTLPPVSHFLLAGEESDAIAYGTTIAQSANTIVTSAKITLVSEALSLSGIDLVSFDGRKIATLTRRTTNDTAEYKKIYEFRELNTDSGFVIPAKEAFPIIARAVVRNIGDGGASNQLVQVKNFIMTAFDPVSFQTFSYSFAPPFPQHQTALGQITRVARVGNETDTIHAGTGVLLGSFSFASQEVGDQTVSLTGIFPTVFRSGVNVTNWKISSPDTPGTSSCSIANGNISCIGLGQLGILPTNGSAHVLEIRGDVSFDSSATDTFIQLTLDDPGLPNRPGAITWTDGSGNFNWVESNAPLATGTRWQK